MEDGGYVWNASLKIQKEIIYSGCLKVWSALKEQRAPIKPCTTDIKEYDALVVCCPVWAGKSPAGLNQYLDELENIEGKLGPL